MDISGLFSTPAFGPKGYAIVNLAKSIGQLVTSHLWLVDENYTIAVLLHGIILLMDFLGLAIGQR